MSTPEPDQGFAEFFRTCLPVVTRTLTALTGDTRVVEDIAQDALLIAQHRWGDIRSYDKPEAWVLKVAIRLMRRWRFSGLDCRWSIACYRCLIVGIREPFMRSPGADWCLRAMRRWSRLTLIPIRYSSLPVLSVCCVAFAL